MAAILLVVGQAEAKSPWDQAAPRIDPVTGKIMTYSFPVKRAERIGWEDLSQLDDRPSQSAIPPRVSLGSVATPTNTAASPGAGVDNTFMDDQYRPGGGRMVDFRKRPYIQFTYSDAGSATGTSRYGYNVYDPIAGTWPRGAGAGCEIQPSSTDIGSWVVSDVNSKGMVVVAGDDNISGVLDNHFYFQTAKFSCTFGAGTVIDSSQYNDGFLTKANALHHPRIEIQEWAGDTITHVVATESNSSPNPPPADAFMQNTVNYFRKIGTTAGSGTWIGPVVIDTCRFNAVPTITASRVSPKVAIAYCAYSPSGYAHRQRNDIDIFYRVSDSVGLSWHAPVNLTQYQRSVAGYSAYTETKCLYDLQGFLHIVWYARPLPANVYSIANFFWDDLQSSIFHWTDRTGRIAKVHNAEWGADANQIVCGFGSPGVSYVGYVDVSECNNRLYIVFSQYCNYFGNDATPTTPANIDDCSSSYTQRLYAANGEIFMCVSNDLDGTLWDAARNLTKTYTPKCDSSTGTGGVCMNDTRATMSRYGMDVTSFDTNGTPVSLIWPGTELVDPTPSPGSYSGNNFLHLLYTEDHWPGPGWRSATTYGRITLNPLKWMRLACVDPVAAPQILYTPTSMGYPGWVHHGQTDTIPVIVTNEGNATLNITTIGVVKQSAQTFDWLGTSASSLSVPAGSPNTDTFKVYVNLGGAVNLPGTIYTLNGYVYMKSNAKSPRDSVIVQIYQYLVADTLVDMKWDTVSTTCTRLVVSNNGEIGRLGLKRVNMDYVAVGGDCDTTASVYAYDGGPIVIRSNGLVYSNALYHNNFTSTKAFKPYAQGSGAGPITTVDYDGYYTGTFVNRDTSIGVRRTYYAPTVGNDTCNFIIQKTVFYGIGGPKSNVTLGEVVDWDIPTYTPDAATNDGRILVSKSVVYQQGLDTSSTRCQKHSNRYGSIAFLGMYTPAELLADTCFNDVAFYGAYTMLNDTLFKYDSDTSTTGGTYFWNQMSSHPGLSAAPVQAKDLHMVMTYKSGLPTLDTLTVYTALVSVKNGDTTALKTGIDKAKKWYMGGYVRGRCAIGPCCITNSTDGRTGNVDNDPDKLVDISDLIALVNYLYVAPFTEPACLGSANIDGDVDNLVDISDLIALVNFLYVSFTPPAICHY